MRQIHIANNVAPKLGGAGALTYQLWVDGDGGLYVQIVKNSDGGSFSSLRFPVAEYALHRYKTLEKPVGFELDGKTKRASKDNNDGAFLKAVLQHLLDEETAA